MSENNSKGGSCLKYFIILLIIWGIAKYFDTPSYSVCGEYSFTEYAKSVFSDNDIAEMIGREKVSEFKDRLKNEASATYVLTLSDPEQLDKNQTRGKIYLGMQTKFSGIIAYKGKFLTTPNDSIADGILRIEERHNDRTDSWEQITFSNSQNILFYKISGKDIVITSKTTSDLGLVFKDAKFTKD
jgi:hypothetical protein